MAAPQHCLVQPNLQFASKEQFHEKSTYGLLSHIFASGINYVWTAKLTLNWENPAPKSYSFILFYFLPFYAKSAFVLPHMWLTTVTNAVLYIPNMKTSLNRS